MDKMTYGTEYRELFIFSRDYIIKKSLKEYEFEILDKVGKDPRNFEIRGVALDKGLYFMIEISLGIDRHYRRMWRWTIIPEAAVIKSKDETATVVGKAIFGYSKEKPNPFDLLLEHATNRGEEMRYSEKALIRLMRSAT